MKERKKKWFEFIKKIIKIRYKKTKFIYLGEEISNGAVIVCNHEGSDGPMAWEIYSGKPIAFWGAWQMNSGVKTAYSYQSKIYFHQKKGWNLFLARLFCLIASPITSMFYKGLDVVSTYPDARLKKTMKESAERLESGKNIVVFPEMSENGYKDTLDGFHSGVVLFLDLQKRKGIDNTVYTAYFNKEKNICLVSAPKKYSELEAGCSSREEIAQKLCDECNDLGKQTFSMEAGKVRNFSKRLYTSKNLKLLNYCINDSI